MHLGRPGHALEHLQLCFGGPAWQAFKRVHDQSVAAPAWHTRQVYPFAGAGQADVLLVGADLLAKAQRYLAAVEHLQFAGAGTTRQFIADGGRQVRIRPPYVLSSRRQATRKAAVSPGKLGWPGACVRQLADRFVQLEALQGVFQQGWQPLVLGQGPAQCVFVGVADGKYPL
ncbi:hypothetical protein D3C80_1602710 [compost metagenome]